MILGGETEVRGGNPPFPRVLYETLKTIIALNILIRERGMNVLAKKNDVNSWS